MSLQLVQKEILGNQYEMRPLTSSEGEELAAEILPLIFGMDSTTQIATNIKAVDRKKLVAVFKPLTFVNGKPLKDIYDTHYVRNWGEWILWIQWGVQVNFASFLDILPPEVKAELPAEVLAQVVAR